MNYFIFVLGCQMNIYDAQKIDTLLRSYGLNPSSEKEADIIFVLACSVRQSAVDRIYGKLRNWKDKKIILGGCVLPYDKQKLQEKVDFIVPSLDEGKLRQILSKLAKKSITPLKNFSPEISKHKESYITIMQGCDNFCTYCAVPYTRGREVSRPEKEIVAEVKELVKQGAKRIILLGQNVNNYGIKNYELRIKKNPFIELLKKIIKIPGNFKIGFLTSNPWNFPEELIDLIAKEPKLLKEIHLPVQSGDDEVLRRMNRHYTAKEYLQLINDLRFKIHDLRLSTDIIVGFPGETKKAFENTVKLCKMAKFDKAYVAMYSPRPGTVAAKLYKDDVPYEEKKRRWQILNKMINEN